MSNNKGGGEQNQRRVNIMSRNKSQRKIA